MTTYDASTRPGVSASPPTAPRSSLFSALIGLAGLTILLQAVWAGLFVHEGEDYQASWVEVHARGADVAIGLTVIALIVAVVTLRARRDLLIGTVAILVLLVLEAYLGGLIGDHSSLTVIHFPLGMALMALAVWLPLRSRRAPVAAAAVA